MVTTKTTDNTSSDYFFEDNSETNSIDVISVESDYTGEKTRLFSNLGSSSFKEVNSANRKFLLYLNDWSPYFINLIKHVSFEDGVYNEASDYVQSLLYLNESVTCNWLNMLLDKYRDDSAIVSSILYIIALLEIDDLYIGSLMNIIAFAYASGDMDLEMSALKVMENIRSASCYSILCGVTISHKWIADYAAKLINELESELGDAA